tara:strand:+ start:359 stop:559 length:201 start_codon:yes stop_codon:yes gene_type:complete
MKNSEMLLDQLSNSLSKIDNIFHILEDRKQQVKDSSNNPETLRFIEDLTKDIVFLLEPDSGNGEIH